MSEKMKDAKMETTIIPAKDKKTKTPWNRARNTDKDNELFKLRSELNSAREEAERELAKSWTNELVEEYARYRFRAYKVSLPFKSARGWLAGKRGRDEGRRVH